jgi:hypothetical protein
VPDAKPPGADFEGPLRALHEAAVEHIPVGSAAATAHGSTRLTLDVDVVYARSAGPMALINAVWRDRVAKRSESWERPGSTSSAAW